MKLTLAIICGNIEPAIFSRFLTQFKPLADSIVAVFAPGRDVPDDRLLTIALHFGISTGTYRNGDAGRDWPHVDDFAAARNAAFDLAAKDNPDWIMWADTDDLIEPQAIAAIRAGLEKIPPDIDMVQLPYRIPYQSVTLWRERAIRPGKARWKSPVHEFLELTSGDKSRVVRIAEGLITHAPDEAEKTDDGRNLRILEAIPESQLSASHRYHLCQEHLANHNIAAAMEYGMRFIGSPDAPAPEVYDIALTLAQVTSAEQAAVFRSLALIKCPERREAYYEFAHACLAAGEGEKAAAWCRAAQAQPMPDSADAPWNIRGKMYGWAGVQLMAASERAAGNTARGDAIEYNFAREHGPRISLVHATRGRPDQAARARGLWLERAAHAEAIEHFFVVDEDDEASRPLNQFRCYTVRGGFGPVAAWNFGAQQSVGEVVIQMSDDWEPPQDWDSAILSRLDVTKPEVLRVSDGSRGDGLICMAIVTRPYLKLIGGHLFHPGFFSMFSDNWFTMQAERASVIVDAPQLVFKHLHPMLGHGEMDETYARSNSLLHYAEGFQLFRLLRDGDPGRTWREIGGWGEFGEVTADAFHHIAPGGTYVEVGVAFGRNLCAAASCADFLNQHSPPFGEHGIKVIGVDNFRPGEDCSDLPREGMEAACRANLDALGVAAEIIVGDSAAVAERFPEKSLSVVCLDASHDYESVKADLAAWGPRIAPKGVFFGHDIDSPDVLRAIEEYAGARCLPVVAKGECWWIEFP